MGGRDDIFDLGDLGRLERVRGHGLTRYGVQYRYNGHYTPSALALPTPRPHPHPAPAVARRSVGTKRRYRSRVSPSRYAMEKSIPCRKGDRHSRSKQRAFASFYG